MKKKSLDIRPLPTVADLLSGELDFLEYSTQKRNLAYQLQLFNFFKEIFSHYEVDRGLRSIFIFEVCCTGAAIVEGLLFCAMKQKAVDPKATLGRHRKAKGLINWAKGEGLITRELSEDLEKIILLRNELHPEKQAELHTKMLTEGSYEEVDTAVQKLIASLRKKMGRQKPVSSSQSLAPVLDEEICPYCEVMVEVGEMCPACGNIKMY